MSAIGAEIRRLRNARGILFVVLCAKVERVPTYMAQIESGARQCSEELAARLADVFELQGLERVVFIASRLLEADAPAKPPRKHRRLTLAPGGCSGRCAEHDGRMVPDGPATVGPDRFERCLNYSHCLGEFAKKYKGAESAHCPPSCSKASFVPAVVARAQRIAEATSGGTWGGMTYPEGAPVVRRRKVA